MDEHDALLAVLHDAVKRPTFLGKCAICGRHLVGDDPVVAFTIRDRCLVQVDLRGSEPWSGVRCVCQQCVSWLWREAMMNEREALVAALRDGVADLARENVQLVEQVLQLQAALRDAIRTTTRVTRVTNEVDPADNIDDFDWTPRVQEWARLCNLDLSTINPVAYAPS